MSQFNGFLEQFAQQYNQVNKNNLSVLESMYAVNIEFVDPLHHIHGLDALSHYFEQMYQNINAIEFVIHAHDVVNTGEGYLRWRMRFVHPRLNGGQWIEVEGCSHLCWRDDKVYYHRDYFDAGALLYEQLPIMGRVIAWLKRRLG